MNTAESAENEVLADQAEKNKLPSWMTMDAESVTVKLTVKSKVSGIERDSVRMRSPSMRELRTAQEFHKGDKNAVELMLFSSLLEASNDELLALKVKDYMRLQEGYFRLVEEDED